MVRIRCLALGILGLVVLVLTTASSPVRANGEPVLVASFGMWSLERLGYGDLDLPITGRVSRMSLTYALPPDAAQGPDVWYLMHFHAEVTVAPDSGPGFAILTAYSSGWAGVQFKITTTLGPDSLTVGASSLDLIQGPTRDSSNSTVLELRSQNYLPIRGVQPGRNELAFGLQQFEDIRLTRVRVFRDSGIEVSPIGPAGLWLSPVMPKSRIRAGDTFEIGYRLQNIRGRTAQNVAVGISYPKDAFLLLSEAPHQYASVPDEVTGAFRLKALIPGTYTITLGVESPSSNPLVHLNAVIYEPVPPLWRDPRLWIAAPLFALSVALLARAALMSRTSR